MDIKYILLSPLIIIIPLGISMISDYYQVLYNHNQESKKK